MDTNALSRSSLDSMPSGTGSSSYGVHVSPHQSRPLIKSDDESPSSEMSTSIASPTSSGRLNVRALPQTAFMVLSFGILLFALYFIGSVVIESALPSASHSNTNNNKSQQSTTSNNSRPKTPAGRTHVQSLESIEGNTIRGRPAGGSALDASLKKRKEQNEILIGRIKTDQGNQNAYTSIHDENIIESSDGEEEETHFADRIRNNALALATSSWERWSRKNPPENVPQRPMPTRASDPTLSPLQKEMDHSNDEEEDEDVIPGTSINYNLKPELFTSTISQCLLDRQCRIIYHHVGKSGGTTLEDTFFHMYPPELKSCCGPKLLGKLANDEKSREKYCAAKFSSYQIIGSHVEGLVKSCMRINSDDVAATSGSKNDEQNTTANVSSEDDHGHDTPRRPRSVVLTTYREPISRTLSSIHQLCNKQSNKRSNETLEACAECRYEFGTDVWDRVVNMTNDHFEGVAEVASLRIPGVRVISLDMVDISPALDRLRERLPLDAKKLKVKGIPDVPITQWRNPERKSVCAFAMTSEMIKSLGVAQAVYRNLTAGFL